MVRDHRARLLHPVEGVTAVLLPTAADALPAEVDLVPLAPKLVRLRIRFRRWLGWNWAADLLENHFQGWVLFFRIMLFVVAVVLLYLGWTQ